jgi:FkbM family methyltransferase
MSLRWLRRRWKRRVWMYVRRRVRPLTVVPVDDFRLTIDLNDRGLGRMLYFGDDHEPELRALMRQLPLAGGVCVDVGANVGLHTVVMSRLVGPGGRVFAFEPDPHNFRLLETNLRLNGARNATARQCAIGDADGVCRLARNPRNYADCRVTSDLPAWSSHEVPMTTLDAALPDLPPGAIRFLKLDVQGSECRVLRGMRRTLVRHPDLVMVVEVFPGGLGQAGASARELIELLTDLGFSGWEFTRDRVQPMAQPWVYDLMTGGNTDVVVSRNEERLREIVSRWRGIRLQPTPTAWGAPGAPHQNKV